MKINMVFCAFVASISLHVQASPTVTQNSITSSWIHDFNNQSNHDIFFGGSSLSKGNTNRFKANSDRKVNWKTPADAMQFVYTDGNVVQYSTVDHHSSFDATLTVIKWVDNKPDSIAQCQSVVTDIYGNYGYTLRYSVDKSLSAELFDRPNTPHVKPIDQCVISLNYAKDNIPKAIK